MSWRVRGVHRTARWLWTGRDPAARLTRTALLPVSALFRAVVALRTAAYARGLLPVRELGLPAVGVGNLTVGGSGKTPLAAWVAQHYESGGLVPGILLRGHGEDERFVHERLVPAAVVVADPDRVSGARVARKRGAQVLVLDDAYQRLDVRRDLNIAVVAAETSRAVSWPLPAGPWREGLAALDRADLIVVTRKRADRDVAGAVATALAERVPGRPVARCHLGISRLEGMLSGRRLEPEMLRGRQVLASAGVADPEAFAAQVRAAGAGVRLVSWDDHHAYSAADVAWLAGEAQEVDFVLVTEKDAVKLRRRWPAPTGGVGEPLVAVLDVTWEAGEAMVRAALDAVVRDRAEMRL